MIKQKKDPGESINEIVLDGKQLKHDNLERLERKYKNKGKKKHVGGKYSESRYD